ncbi:baseplate assembly protein [Arvimicrobium flavum]|uniref:baseplate assembly protein n=1 Tax=Arvimicrobium flavum TaxID=3393320 RepID=UPI00237BF8B0|nr:baseplate assembly protein [Mesorhizobium shangrilense]
MIEALVDMRIDIEMLKTAFGNALVVGPVEVIDAKRGFRLKHGDGPDGQPYLSPWYPHPESGGATGTWFPLSKGQIVGVINPGGDPRQGVMFRGGFSGINPQISENLGENKYTFGGVTITVAGGVVTIDGDIRVNGRLHATEGLRGDAGVFSPTGVWVPSPVFIGEV